MTTQIKSYQSGVGMLLNAILNLPYGPIEPSVQAQLDQAIRFWQADPLFISNKFAQQRGFVDEREVIKAGLKADFKDRNGVQHSFECGVLWALDKAIGPEVLSEKERRTLVNTACDYLEFKLNVPVPEWIFDDKRIKNAPGRATLIAQDIKQWLQNFHYDTVLAQADACSHNHVEVSNG